MHTHVQEITKTSSREVFCFDYVLVFLALWLFLPDITNLQVTSTCS